MATTVAWVVFKHHKKADGTYNPKIRVSHNGTSSYIATSINTELVKFKRGASSGTVTSDTIKDELDGVVRSYRKIINENVFLVSGCDTSKDVVKIIESKKKNDMIDFIEFARRDIARIKNEGTRTVKTTGINSLCHYLRETTGEERLNIHNLTSSFLRKYEQWLRSERMITVKQKKGLKHEYKTIKKPPLNNTGIHSFMGVIQSIFNNALLEYNDYELGNIEITNNPFKAYIIPRVLEAKKRAVDAEIIHKIYNFEPSGRKARTLEFTRDVYILSFVLAGMNASDMVNCKIVNGRIEYERQKTKDRRKDRAFISIAIHPLISGIIEKYRDKSEERVFDFHTRYIDVRSLTKCFHRGMRSLCEELGIENIQFYSARHSFATIARNDCGVSKDDIALCLNHSSGRSITDVYIKQDFSIIDTVVNKVVKHVFGMDNGKDSKD